MVEEDAVQHRARRLADRLPNPDLVDGTLVLSGLGAPTSEPPAVVGWSTGTDRAGLGLQRTVAGALREVNRLRGERALLTWLRHTRNAELVVVLGEDLAALVGLVLAFAFVGAACIAALIVVEQRVSHPILTFRLLHDRLFRTINIASAMMYAGFFGMIFVLPLYLRDLVFLGEIDREFDLSGVDSGGLMAIVLYAAIVVAGIAVLLRRYRWVER